jgi:hypothetical protein
MAIRSLVVGIDGSETSYRAFAMAVGIAVREQGCVHACFVAHVPGAAALGGFLAPFPLVTYPESDDELASFVTKSLRRSRDKLGSGGPSGSSTRPVSVDLPSPRE